jgi:hypothetical protein
MGVNRIMGENRISMEEAKAKRDKLVAERESGVK